MNCLLINPKTSIGFCSPSPDLYRAMGVKNHFPPLGLLTVAGLLPKEWKIQLIDCEVKAYTPQDIQWADLIFTGGTIAHQLETLHIIATAQKYQKPVVVGGPDITSSPHIYSSANFRLLGEAELTLPHFLADYSASKAKPVYSFQEQKADLEKAPIPRYDLHNPKHYNGISMQTSRGCPFQCEFCDIITLYGRVPRFKSHKQVFQELEHLLQLGFRGNIFISDDNFIGNKNRAKSLLEQLIRWQETWKYPFRFSIQATINLANEDELLWLMQRARVTSCFIGIETPDETALNSMKKNQNTHRKMSEDIIKIQSCGIAVTAGMIIGVDGESNNPVDPMIELLDEAGIMETLLTLMFALPNTALAKRLKMENRLLENWDLVTNENKDRSFMGLNFIPTRPRQQVLQDYFRLIHTVYEPKRYFKRMLKHLEIIQSGAKPSLQNRQRTIHERFIKPLPQFLRLCYYLGIKSNYRHFFWSYVWTSTVKRKNGVFQTVSKAVPYLSYAPLRTDALGHS